ncbi:MAG TPA: VOC family protein [Thermodesulfobacteriota bacterium]|nr:VOC family protein [Thermodesulfobacteriota bacterium]
MLPITSVHTILYCQKWKECISFYRDILGFPVVFDNNILVELEPTPNARIGLMDVSRTKRNVTEPETIVLSFQVADIEKTYILLREKSGDTVERKEHRWGAQVVELRDPEGRRVEFWSKRD